MADAAPCRRGVFREACELCRDNCGLVEAGCVSPTPALGKTSTCQQG